MNTLTIHGFWRPGKIAFGIQILQQDGPFCAVRGRHQ